MPCVFLDIQDPANKLTLKAVLESAGHAIGDEPDVVITDDYAGALSRAREVSTIVLASASQVPRAVELMREGVFGYLFVPLQPGEADIRVRQAVASAKAVTHEPPLVSLREAELSTIKETLRRCRNNRSEAARILGIGRNTLLRKLKQAERELTRKE